MNRGAALAAALLLGAVVLRRDTQALSRDVALVVPAREAARTAAASGWPIADFWERARAAGVAGAGFELESLGDLIGRGDAVWFSREEMERWRLAGLIAPSSPLKGDSVWLRDVSAVSRAVEAMRRQGVAASTQAVAGAWVMTLGAASPADAAALPVGFDPSAVRSAADAGLLPVFRIEDARDVSAARSPALRLETGRGRILWIAAGDGAARPAAPGAEERRAPRERMDSWRAAFGGGDDWVALSRGASVEGAALREVPPDRILSAADLPADAPATELRSAILGAGSRLLVVHLRPELGVDPNFDALRTVVARVRSAGFEPRAPSQTADGSAATPAPERWGRYVLAAALALAAPLVAMRQGLRVMRLATCRRRWPRSEPVPEVAGGVLAAMGWSAAFGVAAYSLLDFPEWRLGLFHVPWSLWSIWAPLALSAAALYAADAPEWIQAAGKPVTYGAVIQATAAAALLAALVNPRPAAAWLGFGTAHRWPEELWWLRLRWRETLVGVPALVVGLSRHLARIRELERAHETGVDPRPWLLLGLLAPVGVLRIFGAARAPLAALLGQTAVGVLLGSAVGVVVAVSFATLRSPAVSK